jgi:molybdenum cofactor cytidylyltransferase
VTGADEGEAETLEAIVLAAGAGSRFGGGKLLAPRGAGVLLDGALAAAFAAPAAMVSVVWGADPRVAEAAGAFAERAGQTGRLRLVRAERHAEGLSASLRAGIAALDRDCAGAFVFLGDMPRIPVAVLAPLAQRLRAGALAAAPVFDGRRGHPVLFGAALFSALTVLSGDRGAASVLEGLGERLALVDAPNDGVLFDVDRPSDLNISAHPRENGDPGVLS